ncbi:MAG TPA: hypothetical protein VGP02_16240 [Mycobacteriales bacterium]|nr:hypothetical protein [Mycobacteriales bacterium]
MNDPRGPAVALATGAGRFGRGAVSGAVCTALSVAWHVVGGASLPGIGALLLALGVATAASTWWAGRRRGPVALAALTAGLQLVLHAVFQLVAGHPADAGSPPAMTTAHVLAALGVAWVLVRGEDTLWELCAVLTRVGAPRSTPVPLPRPARVSFAGHVHDLPVRRGVLLARARPRRGPPLLPVV